MMHGDDENGLPDLSNRRLLQILMQEIADTRRELKEEMVAMGRELHGKIDRVHQSLSKRIDDLTSEFRGFRIEVHQNQVTFITNHTALEKRVTVLEAKVG